MLRDFGHPIVVAARYREGPQYAVGPTFYPYWIFAVRMIVLIEVCASAFVFLAKVIVGSGGGVSVAEAFGQAIGSGLTGAMTLIGFATVAAWLIERKSINIDYLNNWRVRDLRFLDFAFLEWGDISEWMDKMDTAKSGGAATAGAWTNPYMFRHGWSRRDASAGRGIAAIVGGFVFILWWVGIISFGLTPFTVDYPAMNVDPGALITVDFPALKSALYWPVLAYFTALIGFGFVVLVYPRGVRMRGLIDIFIGLSALALAAWVWTASPVGDAIRVDSLQALIERFAAFFQHPMPLPLVTLATFIVLTTGIGGAFRALGGVWEVLSGTPRYAEDE